MTVSPLTESAKAAELGVTRMTLNRYRRGRRMPPELARKLAILDRKIVRVDPSTLNEKE